MPNGANPTKRQHFVPQVYLRGFSPDYRREGGSESGCVYWYDLVNNEQSNMPVPVKSICAADWLYEFRDDNDKFIDTNHLENILSCFEERFAQHRRTLERFAFNEENYKIESFLRTEEKQFWFAFIMIQMMRTSDVMQQASQAIMEVGGDRLTKQKADIISKVLCMPFYRKYVPDGKKTAFDVFLEPMLNMSIGVGVDPSGMLVTSDRPVFVVCKDGVPCEEYERVLFPVSAQLCIYLIGKDDKKQCRKNFLFPISDEERAEVLKSMAAAPVRKIYANHRLNEREILLIKEVREESGQSSYFTGEPAR